MRKISLIFFLISILSSCNKDENTNNLIGEYKIYSVTSNNIIKDISEGIINITSDKLYLEARFKNDSIAKYEGYIIDDTLYNDNMTKIGYVSLSNVCLSFTTDLNKHTNIGDVIYKAKHN